jgi:hypothetical protein
MRNGTRVSSGFKGMGWIFAGAGTLLLISAGLEFFVRQTVEQTSLPTILELLYLAFWSYVAGVVLLIVAPLWLVVSWLVANRHASNTRAREKPKIRIVQEPALQSPESLNDERAVTFPERSSENRADGGEPNGLTRVA